MEPVLLHPLVRGDGAGFLGWRNCFSYYYTGQTTREIIMLERDFANPKYFNKETRQKGLQSNSAPMLSLFSLYNAPRAQKSKLVMRKEELQCSVVNSSGAL